MFHNKKLALSLAKTGACGAFLLSVLVSCDNNEYKGTDIQPHTKETYEQYKQDLIKAREYQYQQEQTYNQECLQLILDSVPKQK